MRVPLVEERAPAPVLRRAPSARLEGSVSKPGLRTRSRLGSLAVAFVLLALIAAPASPTLAADPGLLNTADRTAVINAFYDSWLTNERAPLSWSGSADGCLLGGVNAEGQQATQDQINYFRRMSGLEPITLDAAMSAQAQATALLMEANNDIDHYPPSSWTCWSQYAADGAASSNLALGNTGAGAITAYMTDDGDNNLAAGHRQWIQTPSIRFMGSGSTHSTNALKVFGGPAGATSDVTTPAWVSWPSPGYFPAPLEPLGRWSWFPVTRKDAASTTTIDASQARVSVLGPGGPLPVTLNPGTKLVWQLPARSLPRPTPGNDVTLTVTISGLTQTVRTTSPAATATTPLAPLSYSVILVSPDRPLQALTPPTLPPVLPMVGQRWLLGSNRAGTYLHTDNVDLRAVEWLRDGALTGRGSSRRLQPGDVGHQISARLTVRDYDAYFVDTAVETEPRQVFDRPSIRGVARVGARLSLIKTWPSTVQARWRWTRDGRPVRGARGLHYRPQAADRGHALAVSFILRSPGFVRLSATTKPVRVR